MPLTEDLYRVLEVTPDADDGKLKRAFRRLAKIHHPDRNPDDPDAEERFKSAGYAYRVLADPRLRRRYDEFGHDGLRDDFIEPADVSDVPASGPRPWRAAKVGPPAPLRITVQVTPDEARNGFTREITYDRRVDCPRCAGTGGKQPRVCGGCNGLGRTRLGGPECSTCYGTGRRFSAPCKRCRGRGGVRAMHTVLIRVPAGADGSSLVRVRAKGHQYGAVSGDVHVTLAVVAPEPRPPDVTLDLPISIAEAVLGAKVAVQTPSGGVTLTIPPGSSGGRKLRLRGRGGAGDEPPDLIVRLRIVVPGGISKEAREHLEAFARLDDTKPRQG